MKPLLFALGFAPLTVAPAEAISCAGVTDVTALPAAGCADGGFTFSGFAVSPSAGFAETTVGIGAVTQNVNGTNLNFQLAVPGPGPGDVLLSYAVATPTGSLVEVDLANNAILAPVTIGELVCRQPFGPLGTCAPADRLAALVAGPGEHVVALLSDAVASAGIRKDISFGFGGFLTDFTNSHRRVVTAPPPPVPVPEPATLLLVASSLGAAGLVARRRARPR